MKRPLFLASAPNMSAGFTLLEMVMVVFIMGILASVSLTFLDSQNEQWRFDDTVRKLDSVQRALLYQPANQRLLMSGFVVDNGVLPPIPITGDDKLEPLITSTKNSGDWFSSAASGTWADYGAIPPIYQVKSGATADHHVLAVSYSLHKGYRGGYLKEGVDSNQEVRDGWGEAFTVTGPTLAVPTDPYKVDFTARDGFPALSKTLNTVDWKISLSSLEFSLGNRIDPATLVVPATPLGSDLDAAHVLAVLVFNNKQTTDAEDRWDTYHFTIPVPASPATVFASGDIRSFPAASQTWYKNGDTTTVIDPLTEMLPVGEHLVLVLKNKDFSAVNPADFQRFKLYPRVLHEAISVDITVP